jgi:signal transduction histidine kinase
VNTFIHQAVRLSDKLTVEQLCDVLESAVDEIDRLETVLDSLYTGVLVCDAESKLLLTNRSAHRMLSMHEYEHGGTLVWNVIIDEVIAGFVQKTLSSGDRVEGREFEAEIRGVRRLLSFDSLPLVKQFQVIGTVILIRDITKKRVREARLRRVESLASLTTLAAGLAHEIKNPLASISIHFQLIRKMLEKSREDCPEIEQVLPSEKLFGHFNIVTEEVERLNRIVVDFLYAVRPMNLSMRSGSINEVIDGIIKFMEREFCEQKIHCAVYLAPDIPVIEFDERYMKEALLNLVKNAVEAMQENGGTLTIKTELTDTGIIISIADTGYGIKAEDQAKIFEPYWTTKEMGTGLGLTHVFKIIREHRGEISVLSKPGEGSTFKITLPLPRSRWRLLDN